MMMLSPVAIIEKKKLGKKLSTEEIEWMVKSHLSGTVRDYQMSAWLMAIYFRGLSDRETADLTSAMLASGKTLKPGPAGFARVDKHSTGGVGDKVSIALAPLAAELGMKVPMLSGRSLGHTGGTLDKLESIPHFRPLLSMKEMERIIDKVGCFISGQTEEIAPADKALYALRDVTGTVDCIPLITSSILSKKLAEGIKSLVMDVKFGSGAFMRSVSSARLLAEALVKTGRKTGLEVRVLLTRMDEPLGFAVGNSLEVMEAAGLLRGKGPEDLLEVTRALAAEMLLCTGKGLGRKRALSMVDDAILSGNAFKRFRKWVEAQGGRLRFDREDLGLKAAPAKRSVRAASSGYITRMDARGIGLIVVDLGGGRKVLDEKIDHSVGLVLKKKIGDKVSKGETLATLYANNQEMLFKAEQKLLSAITVERNPLRKRHRLVRHFRAS